MSQKQSFLKHYIEFNIKFNFAEKIFIYVTINEYEYGTFIETTIIYI